MKVVIEINDIPKNDHERWVLSHGTPIPKGHGFIAICDSDYPITEEVKQELKNTVFVGNEDCHYCFDITEIIEVESEDNSMDRNCENCKHHTDNGCTSWDCEYEPKESEEEE